MVILQAVKVALFAAFMIPLGFAAVATGLVFGAFNLAVSRNPEEKDYLFSNSLVAFALIESFVFIGLLVTVVAYIVT